MAQHVEGFGVFEGIVVTAKLDPTTQPFLFDHQIDGTPVLPGVMGVEAFAETAHLAFPDLHIVAVEDMDFLAPFKFYRNEPRTLKVMATFTAEGDEVVAHCRLVGQRTLANQTEPQVTTHFTGRVRLGEKPPRPGKTKVETPAGRAASPADIYEIYFHGPAYQVLDQAWGTADMAAGLMAADLPDNHVPDSTPTVTAPRLAELAFQASGIWEIGTTGVMALPMHIDRVVYAGDPAKAKGRMTAMVTPHDGGFDIRVADERGATFVVMEGYRTVPMPAGLPDEQVAPLRRAVTEDA